VFLFHRHKIIDVIQAGRPDFLLKAGKNNVKVQNSINAKSFLSRQISIKTRIEFSTRVSKYYPAGAVQAILPFPFVRWMTVAAEFGFQ